MIKCLRLAGMISPGAEIIPVAPKELGPNAGSVSSSRRAIARQYPRHRIGTGFANRPPSQRAATRFPVMVVNAVKRELTSPEKTKLTDRGRQTTIYLIPNTHCLPHSRFNHAGASLRGYRCSRPYRLARLTKTKAGDRQTTAHARRRNTDPAPPPSPRKASQAAIADCDPCRSPQHARPHRNRGCVEAPKRR